MLTDQEKRDLDETRRLAYVAFATLETDYSGVEPDVAGTLMHAVAHHSGLVPPDAALEIGRELVDGRHADPLLRRIIDQCTEWLCES